MFARNEVCELADTGCKETLHIVIVTDPLVMFCT